jgi:hypothetical protein
MEKEATGRTVGWGKDASLSPTGAPQDLSHCGPSQLPLGDWQSGSSGRELAKESLPLSSGAQTERNSPSVQEATEPLSPMGSNPGSQVGAQLHLWPLHHSQP